MQVPPQAGCRYIENTIRRRKMDGPLQPIYPHDDYDPVKVAELSVGIMLDFAS
jgi:hypothetical protein